MEGEIEAMTDLTLVTGAGEGDQQQIYIYICRISCLDFKSS